jgi:hypothetical protein
MVAIAVKKPANILMLKLEPSLKTANYPSENDFMFFTSLLIIKKASLLVN